MNKLIAGVAGLAFATTMALAPAANAAVNYDPATGGFVGKGDVQLALGYNNAQIQRHAETIAFLFTYVGTTVQDTSWICSRTNPQGTEQTQERVRVTTTEVSGVASHVLRDNRKQVTGFLMQPVSGGTSTSTSEGPPLGSCPQGWTASTPITGDPESTGQLFVDGRPLG